jgi:hypothetical protein
VLEVEVINEEGEESQSFSRSRTPFLLKLEEKTQLVELLLAVIINRRRPKGGDTFSLFDFKQNHPSVCKHKNKKQKKEEAREEREKNEKGF